MKRKLKKKLKIILDSPSEVPVTHNDYFIQTLSPIFRQNILPEDDIEGEEDGHAREDEEEQKVIY
jgi:hypothetical protein